MRDAGQQRLDVGRHDAAVELAVAEEQLRSGIRINDEMSQVGAHVLDHCATEQFMRGCRFGASGARHEHDVFQILLVHGFGHSRAKLKISVPEAQGRDTLGRVVGGDERNNRASTQPHYVPDFYSVMVHHGKQVFGLRAGVPGG